MLAMHYEVPSDYVRDSAFTALSVCPDHVL